MAPRSEPEATQLPVVRLRAPVDTYQLGFGATPDEARRIVAVVMGERTTMGALKCERRRFSSSDFIAKVINGSDEALSCSISGWTRRGPTDLLPGNFWIGPQSVAQVAIRAPLRFPYRLRTISLHLRNSAMRACAEADVPTPPVIRVASAIVMLLAAALVGLTAWQSIRPKIAAYALPAHVAAGDVATASYAVSGIGTPQYEVTVGGAPLASGVLTSGAGAFSFATLKHAAVYHVVLSVVSPFGIVRKELDATGLVVTSAELAAIKALQPDPSIVHSGEPIDVRYIADAQSGSVTLFDAAGIPLQSVPYRSAGSSTLTAPAVETPTQYRVELRVLRGASTSRASAGLLVLPKKSGAENVANIPGVLTATQVLRVDPAYVRSDENFVVRVLRPLNRLRLTFEDDLGTRIATQQVSATQALVRFDAPYVSHDRSFVIVASFSRGAVAQVLLQPVLIHARPSPVGP